MTKPKWEEGVTTDTAAPVGASASPSEFAVTLFGPMQVLLHDRPLPHLRSRKALWLLALLLLRHGRPVERHWLAGTLWPDVGETRSAASLRAVLSELRGALGSQGTRLRSPSRHTVSLDLAGARVDVLTFDAAVANGDIPALRDAVPLYKGPLLEGCAEEWVAQERAAREQGCLRALQRLATDALAADDVSSAATYWQRAVSLDPLWEVACRGLMESLARGGDRNAALHVYRELVGRIQRGDPKAAPAEETTDLYRRLRAQAHRRVGEPVDATATPASEPAIKGALPQPLTELVGREDECSEVAARLRRSRLVTLTGPGGIGKTRLAIAVAENVRREYQGGAWLVALDGFSDPALLPQAVARVLGVPDEARRPLSDTLATFFQNKQLLLVLDNCEHLLQASAELADRLLRHSTGLRVLATSREALGVTGETVWAVPPLAVPNPDHLPEGPSTRVRVLSGYDGVQLFVERAQSVQKNFALTASNASAVATICSRLEGVPLALELAAVRVRSLTAEQIAERLGDHLSGQLGLLTHGSRTALSRQQTLRAALDWSYILLSDGERSLLRRLSVFAGGWHLTAAEQICAGDGIASGQVLDLLTSLVDKSLVVFTPQPEDADEGANGTGGRYRLLEMVRQYACEKREEHGESAEIQERHAAWFLALAEKIEPHLRGSKPETYLQQLEADRDNFHAALLWGATGARDPEWGLRLAGALWWFWRVRGRYSEGRQYLGAAIANPRAQDATHARAKALNSEGALALNQGDFDASRRLHEQSLGIYRKLGDDPGIASVLNNLGSNSSHLSDYASARAFFEESLAISRRRNDGVGVSRALGNLGCVLRLLGDYAAARACFEEGLQMRRDRGDKQGIALGLANLGNLVRLQGDHGTAHRLLTESLEICREVGDIQGIAYALSHLGAGATATGDFAAARRYFEESLQIRRKLGQKASIAWSHTNLGVIALWEGKIASARTLLQESLSLFRGLKDNGGIAWSQHHLGDVAHHCGEYAQARAIFEESLRLFHTIGDKEGVAENLRDLGDVWANLKDAQKAARLWGAAEALREKIGSPLPPIEQERYEQEVARARAAATEPNTFPLAWNEGRALDWEQATHDALRSGGTER